MGDQDGAATAGAVDGVEATAAPSTTMSGSMMGGFGLRFNPPKNFNGKEEEFDPFSYRLKAYLAMFNAKFKKLMVDAQEQDDPVDFDILHEDEKILAAQLHNMLINLCDGPAARIVRRNDDASDNGFETLRL